MSAAGPRTGGAPGLSGAMDIWMAGLAIGASALRREPVLGLKRLVQPASYWRTAEFAYVGRRLDAPRGARVFDLGSPKDLAAMLARHRGYEVVATDIFAPAVELSERYARAQGLSGEGPGRVRSEIQDGRAITYPDDSFDAAFSVSVLEHVPEHGDSTAIAELVRIVKPGGVVVATVPYDREYRETWVNRDVYDRRQESGTPVFFERHYDDAQLEERLVRPSGAELVHLERWGEGAVRMESLLRRLGRAELPLSPLHPLLSRLFLRPLHNGDGHPMAAFFTLRKPG